ncbi:MAG: hypothetical protein QW778_03825 [Candidatus Micrarchaeaceae archaeon]
MHLKESEECSQNTSSCLILWIIPHYDRIHKIKPEIIILKNKEFVGSDGTCLKTSNAGEYRQFKYGDPNAKRKKNLVVNNNADLKKKKLLHLEHIQGESQSEPNLAEKLIKESNKKI